MLDIRTFQATEKGKSSDWAMIQTFAQDGLLRVIREAILGGSDRPVIWGLTLSPGPGNSNVGPVAQVAAGGVLTGDAGGFEIASFTVAAADGLTAAVGADKVFDVAARPARKGTDPQVVTLLEVATGRMYPSPVTNKTDHAGVEVRAFEQAAGGGSTIPAGAGWVKFGQVTVTPGAGVAAVDQSMAPTLRALLRQHHTGEAGSAPKIVLTDGKEVAGLLPSTMIKDAHALVNSLLAGAGPITISAPDPDTGKTTINMTRSATAQSVNPVSQGGAAAVVITEQGEFQFSIPQGERGLQGIQGNQGIQGEKGEKGDTGLVSGASEVRMGTFNLSPDDNIQNFSFGTAMGAAPSVVICQYMWVSSEGSTDDKLVGVENFTASGFQARIISTIGGSAKYKFGYIAIR